MTREVKQRHVYCDMDQSDTIGKIELNPGSILLTKDTNSRNDIQ